MPSKQSPVDHELTAAYVLCCKILLIPLVVSLFVAVFLSQPTTTSCMYSNSHFVDYAWFPNIWFRQVPSVTGDKIMCSAMVLRAVSSLSLIIWVVVSWAVIWRHLKPVNVWELVWVSVPTCALLLLITTFAPKDDISKFGLSFQDGWLASSVKTLAHIYFFYFSLFMGGFALVSSIREKNRSR